MTTNTRKIVCTRHLLDAIDNILEGDDQEARVKNAEINTHCDVCGDLASYIVY